MTCPVHILATCNKPALIDAAILVFRTIRTGFPSAKVTVWLNGDPCESGRITDMAMKANCDVERSEPTIHHEWIKHLLNANDEPFWICDTDVIFNSSIEAWKMQGHLSGNLIPEFYCKWSRCVTSPRLHTSLLWFNVPELKTRLEAFESSIRESRFTPLIDLASPVVLPPNRFHDTCSLLYQAVGGTPFTDSQLAAYDHLNGATWVDELEPVYPGITFRQQEIYQNPALAKGSNFAMQSFFQGPRTIEQMCQEVCLGQPDAVLFCHLWFNYCHLIDDLVDSEDRPTAEQFLEPLAMANVLYGTPFYRDHQNLLSPIVLSVTNAYADSVKWEKSCVHRRSTIADVLRCCGNEMFFMVAYICGGWKHQRKISSQIREQSWMLQHDATDKPN